MSDTPPIRILIADDHDIVREGLRSVINIQPDMKVVGEAADGVSAVELARVLEPDVILLDLVMPRQDGLETLRQLKAEGCPAHVIVLTSFAQHDQIFPAIKSGAMGYQLKASSSEQLIQAVRDVYHDQTSLHPLVARKVVEELNRASDLPPTEDPLTAREVEVLKLLAQGLTNQEIADKLIIEESTVASHISNILGKLHLANRTQAALYALREGLASLNQADNFSETGSF
jgi:NarL family two-component system response regulator LiaR